MKKKKITLPKPLKIKQTKQQNIPIKKVVCETEKPVNEEEEEVSEFVRKRVVDSWEY